MNDDLIYIKVQNNLFETVPIVLQHMCLSTIGILSVKVEIKIFCIGVQDFLIDLQLSVDVSTQ